jgi:hypothetical protein
MRLLALSLFLTLSPFTLGAQQTAGAGTWVGCWVLRASSQEQGTLSDTVRLQSKVVRGRAGQQYTANRLSDKPGIVSGPVSWSLGQHGDSVDIRVEALGGTVWRLVQNSGALVGYAYATFDIVPGEHPFGPATGKRSKC